MISRDDLRVKISKLGGIKGRYDLTAAEAKELCEMAKRTPTYDMILYVVTCAFMLGFLRGLRQQR